MRSSKTIIAQHISIERVLRSAQFISKYEPEKEKNKQKGTRKKNLNAETDGKDGMSIVMLVYTVVTRSCVYLFFFPYLLRQLLFGSVKRTLETQSHVPNREEEDAKS